MGPPTLCPPRGVPSGSPLRLLLPPVLGRELVSRCLCPVEAPPHPHLSIGGVTVGAGGVPARRETLPSTLPSPSGLRSARHRGVGSTWAGEPGPSRSPPKKLRESVCGGVGIGSSTRVWGSAVVARALGRHSGRGCLCSGTAQQRAKLEKTAMKLSIQHGSFFYFFFVSIFFLCLTVRFCCTLVRDNFVLWESHFFSCDFFLLLFALSKELAGELGSSPADFRQVGPSR